MRDLRPPEQIREHYELEKTLAARLRTATPDERQYLYREVYDELYRRLPHHPQLAVDTAAVIAAGRAQDIAYEMYSLEPFLGKNTVFAEIGAGDCRLTMTVAPRVKHVYAVDVSTEMTKGLSPPSNFTLLLSNGRDIPVPPGSLDIVFSTQLMEHLHPDDAREQLTNIYNSLARGGIYLCTTPNRINGPHDVSRGFDATATGLHLKEYSVRELAALFSEVGFAQVRTYLRLQKIRTALPGWPTAALEVALEVLPRLVRARIASARGIAHLLGIRIIGVK
jgi:SAM-dependent methyltransferase